MFIKIHFGLFIVYYFSFINLLGIRDHSLDRDRANIKMCHTPGHTPGTESGGSTRCSGEGGCGSHHSSGPSNLSPASPRGRDHHLDWSDHGLRTKDRDPRDRDRNTLPRVKMEIESGVSSGPGPGSVMVEQRHTLPR